MGLTPPLHSTYRHARDGRSVQHLKGQTRHVVRCGMSYSAGRVEKKEDQAAPRLAREAPHDDDAARWPCLVCAGRPAARAVEEC